MRPSHPASLALCCLLAAPLNAQESATLPTAIPHGNVTPAGALADGVLALVLTAERVRWHPEADDGPGVTVDAFSAGGSPASVPGPLVRIPAGTRVETTIRNALPDTLLVFGLSGPAGDTVRIAPGGSGRTRFTAGVPGTYAYGGATIVEDSVRLLGTGNQLLGALVVDGADPLPDRIFVLSIWTAGTGRFVMAINGRSWPHTERLDVNVGEAVQWRIVNGTRGRHPMHLHGFYFRIDSRGSWSADTAMTGQRPMVVTESVPYRGTFTMTWTAERPGNWLFHCHDALHTTWRRRFNLAGERPPPTLPMHDAAHHVEQDMSGLVLGIRANGAAPDGPRSDARRRIRLAVNAKAGLYGREPGLSFVAVDGAEPARDSMEIPSRPLVLTRGESTEITVINRLDMPTGVHWHGIELDSYYDGVGGWSGGEGQIAPVIMPADSFVVRMTPPRAGTFIFHAHVDDMRQIALGLYGALIVMPPGERRDPATDHLFIVSQLGRGQAAFTGLNGAKAPPPLTVAAGERQRLRFINISVADDADFTLGPAGSSDSSMVEWRALAKDGADLPPERSVTGPAHLFITPGETYDFEVTVPLGDYRLRMTGRDDAEVLVHAR